MNYKDYTKDELIEIIKDLKGDIDDFQLEISDLKSEIKELEEEVKNNESSLSIDTVDLIRQKAQYFINKKQNAEIQEFLEILENEKDSSMFHKLKNLPFIP